MGLHEIGMNLRREVFSIREPKEKGGALIKFAGDGDLTAMSIHNGFNDRQPEPRTTRIATARRVYSIESLEDSGQFLIGNPGAVVLHLDVGCIGFVA